MFERTGLPAALAALILAAASAANADPELAVAPVVSAPRAASQPSEERALPADATAQQREERALPATGGGQGPEHTIDKADASEPDDEDSQADIDKSAAELEEVRKAEEKAGLLPQAPGTGPRDGL
ncbi:MAG TPA: hypothetical protein VFE76_10865, partial [Myxococcales bacterium]|nr:hypothetical protein [Myxococcales bacterium]